jgi:hypothetical protein
MRAGVLYAIIVFLIGFILGTIRVLLVVPRLGETTAVIIEAPVMLTASWLICRWCVDRLDVAATVPVRSSIGVKNPLHNRPTATARKRGLLRGPAGRQIRNSGRATPSLRHASGDTFSDRGGPGRSIRGLDPDRRALLVLFAAQHALKSGCAAYVTKPVNIGNLLRTVDSLLPSRSP